MAASSTIGTADPGENSNRAPRFGQSRPITRLSTGADGREAKGGSFDPVLSADGTTLVFASEAGNLVPGDTNGVRDVFLKDLKTGAVTRVSTAADGTQANGASDGLYRSVSLSADGTKIAFASEASNLVPGDTNRTGDIFVKDLGNNTITRIDTTADGTQTPRGSSSTEPVISSDGTKVAFVSSAGTLVPGDTNGARDIFVRDLAAGTVSRVDTAADGTQAEAGSDSFGAVFSPDGTKLAFVSSAANLVPGDSNGAADIFVKDLATGAITRVTPDGTQANGESASPVFSPDGTRIAFVSDASNLVDGDTNGTPDIFIKDLTTGAIIRVSTGSDGAQLSLGGDLVPAFSPDGSRIAFVDSVSQQAYVKDLAAGTLIAVAPVPNAGATQSVAFSADGTQLIFVSGDGTLVPGDTNEALDVFAAWTGQTTTGLVHDMADQVSAGTSGTFAFTDADTGDSHTVKVTPGDGAVGKLTATVSRDSGTAAGVVAWDYSVDHKAVAGLAKGQTKTETFTVTVDDGHGGTAEQVVTITVVADNDAPHIAAFGPFKRLSTDSNGHEANGASLDAVLSADGAKLVFASDADNLVGGDTNGVRDIFIKNLVTGAVTRVSTDAHNAQADDASNEYQSQTGSLDLAISPDGNKVAFFSKASNLVPGDTNNVSDIFVKDLTTGAIDRISTAADGMQADGVSPDGYGSITFSPDGHKVAFVSFANNLLPGVNNDTSNIYVKNLDDNSIARVNIKADGTEPPRGWGSDLPVFSPDGSKIAFISFGDNLVDGDTNGQPDVFVKNLNTQELARVNTDAHGLQANNSSSRGWALVFPHAFSPDGNKLLFTSDADNLVDGDTNGTRDIFLKDLTTQAVTRISTGSDGSELRLSGDLVPTFSHDGTKVAFVDDATGTAYVKDIATGSLTPVAPVRNISTIQQVSFTPDDSELVFVSDNDTLVPDDTNNALDIFKVRIGQTTIGFVQDKADQASSSTSGALPLTDTDIGDIHTVTVKPGDGAVGTLTATIGKEPDSDGPGSIGWTYTVDHKAVADLTKGQSKVETFTVTVDDGHGGTAEQAVTITVRGSETPQAADQIHTDPGGTTSPVPLEHPAADSVPVVDTHHGHGLTGFEF